MYLNIKVFPHKLYNTWMNDKARHNVHTRHLTQLLTQDIWECYLYKSTCDIHCFQKWLQDWIPSSNSLCGASSITRTATWKCQNCWNSLARPKTAPSSQTIFTNAVQTRWLNTPCSYTGRGCLVTHEELHKRRNSGTDFITWSEDGEEF